MIAPWRAIPSPDNVKPSSWRMYVMTYLCAPGEEPLPNVVRAVLDTGSPWSVFTEDIAQRYCGIQDIETGRETSISWPGSTMPAWQHPVKLVIRHSDPPGVSTVFDEFPVLFVHSYIRPGHARPSSLVVLGADFCRHILSVLSGPEARTIM